MRAGSWFQAVGICLTATFWLPATGAGTLTVTDILDRRVELDGPAEKVILGEGRFLATLGVMDVEDPLARVAGMLGEFQRFDPTGFARYRAAFPTIDAVPTFGLTSEQSVSVEKAILLQPDAAIFGIEGHGPGSKSSHIIDKLEAAGIPIVFIDFRQQPLAHTARSVEIVGRVLGLEDKAGEFASFYETEVAKVTDRLAASPPAQCPTVLLELHVGLAESCCRTVAEGLFADMVEATGGCNIAKGRLPGPVGELSLEYVIDTGPDVYIGSAIGTTSGTMAAPGRIVLGAGVDPDTARESLTSALDRPGVRDLPAVDNGRAHAIWHHFYNSPLNVYAFQKFAQWLHPEKFENLDPETTLTRLLEGFRPVDLTGTYSTTIEQ